MGMLNATVGSSVVSPPIGGDDPTHRLREQRDRFWSFPVGEVGGPGCRIPGPFIRLRLFDWHRGSVLYNMATRTWDCALGGVPTG